MGWAPRRNRAPIACPCHQKRSAPFRLLPRLFSDALPVRRYLPWRWHWLPAGVMRRSVSFGEELRRIQRWHLTCYVTAGNPGHRKIQNTTRYKALAPDMTCHALLLTRAKRWGEYYLPLFGGHC